MAGILNDLSSETLALVAARYLPQRNTAYAATAITKESVSGPDFLPAADVTYANFYAALALVEAVRELTAAVKDRDER